MGAILLGLMFALFIAIALLWIVGVLVLGAAAFTDFKNFLGKALEGTSSDQHH